MPDPIEDALRDALESIEPSDTFGSLVDRRIGAREARRRATQRIGVVTALALVVALFVFVGRTEQAEVDVATSPREDRGRSEDQGRNESASRPPDSRRTTTTTATGSSTSTTDTTAAPQGSSGSSSTSTSELPPTSLGVLDPVTTVPGDDPPEDEPPATEAPPPTEASPPTEQPPPDDEPPPSEGPPATGSVVGDPVVTIGATVTLEGGASGSGRHRWSLSTTPPSSSASMSDPGADTPTFVADVEGVYVVRHWVEGETTEASGDVVLVVAIPSSGRTVLVDASTGGGGWWFPQAGPVFDPTADHQGRALANRWRSFGYVVIELPRTTQETRIEVSEALLAGFDAVVRAGDTLSHSSEEISAYHRYVESGGSLLLLSDYKRPGWVAPLALSFGVRMEGTTRGDDVIDTWAAHPITDGSGPVQNGVGSGITSWTESTEIIGWFSDGTYLDLDGDRAQDPDEPTGVAALAVTSWGAGRIVFSTDINMWQFLPQPLVDNTATWLFG